ncbi:MAG: ABC transporter ATP-binding protein [Devosia sp.]
MSASAYPFVLEGVGLSCDVVGENGTAHILRDVSLRVERGRTLGIVGESGAGKSMLVKVLLGIAPRAARVGGDILLDGTHLSPMNRDARRKLVGERIGVVFQNPMSSLNPFVRVGRQIEEASRYYRGLTKAQGRANAIELMRVVGLRDPEECYDQFPHQFSGGMKQRIMIATALACEPDLLIADEATTALDVTVQRDILDLLQRIQQDRRMSMILVTHNLGVVAGRTDEVAVMYGGRIVERGPTEAIFRAPRHRYTEALLSAMPRMDQPAHTKLRTIPGTPPSLVGPMPGCPFAARCAAAEEKCVSTMPATREADTAGHSFACHVPVPAPVLEHHA